MKLDTNQHDILRIKLIASWERSKRKLVSIDGFLYTQLFPYLQPVHTVGQRGSQEVQFVLVDREQAINITKKKHNYGTHIHRDSVRQP